MAEALGIRKRTALRLLEGEQATVRVREELNLEAANPALNASLPHPQVLWAGERSQAEDFNPPGVLIYEPDAVSPAPTFG